MQPSRGGQQKNPQGEQGGKQQQKPQPSQGPKREVASKQDSNAEALRAVMSHVRRKKFDSIVCLGDFVGYCAEPNQVVDAMRTFKAHKLYIRGNHDRVSVGLGEGAGFNPAAKAAAEWTTAHLSAPNRRFLEKLPLGPLRRDDFLLRRHQLPC